MPTIGGAANVLVDLLKVHNVDTLAIVVNVNGTDCCWLTQLNAVQTHILALLGFPSTLYQGIGGQSRELAVWMGEPWGKTFQFAGLSWIGFRSGKCGIRILGFGATEAWYSRDLAAYVHVTTIIKLHCLIMGLSIKYFSAKKLNWAIYRAAIKNQNQKPCYYITNILARTLPYR